MGYAFIAIGTVLHPMDGGVSLFHTHPCFLKYLHVFAFLHEVMLFVLSACLMNNGLF